ncbi:MAG: MGMT family protein [Deltaproteobacteria bacterium]|nr:MGMT family protein [Deltaproteobacteria bacterium]
MATYSSFSNREQYNLSVWAFVKRVPAGKVVTYGQVAKSVSPSPGVAANTYRAFGPRWVGSAMARCPGDVPWQRVVNFRISSMLVRIFAFLKSSPWPIVPMEQEFVAIPMFAGRN